MGWELGPGVCSVAAHSWTLSGSWMVGLHAGIQPCIGAIGVYDSQNRHMAVCRRNKSSSSGF